MNENIETWTNIDGYEGLYQVSNLGRVRSLSRWIWNGKGYFLSKCKILKPALNSDGYQEVCLCKDKKQKVIKIHRLVANAFLPNPLHFKEINHIDEDKTNNRACNLEWCSRLYNCNFGTRNERMTKTCTNGKHSKRVYQINAQTDEIIRLWPSAAECGRNGYDYRRVSACCRGERNFHKGYRWRYVDDSI